MIFGWFWKDFGFSILREISESQPADPPTRGPTNPLASSKTSNTLSGNVVGVMGTLNHRSHMVYVMQPEKQEANKNRCSVS